MPKRKILFGSGLTMVIFCLSFFYIYTWGLENNGNGYENNGVYENNLTNGAELTDDEVIERAMQLGLVYVEDIIIVEEYSEDYLEYNGIVYDDFYDDNFDYDDFLDDEVLITTPNRVRVVIPEGVTAARIAQILKNAGVIENASSFVDVLFDKNYTRRMAFGTFYLEPGTDLEVLADRLVRRRY